MPVYLKISQQRSEGISMAEMAPSPSQVLMSLTMLSRHLCFALPPPGLFCLGHLRAGIWKDARHCPNLLCPGLSALSRGVSFFPHTCAAPGVEISKTHTKHKVELKLAAYMTSVFRLVIFCTLWSLSFLAFKHNKPFH